MKHTIEIEGLPEGWEPVAIRKQKPGEYIFCLDTGFVVPANYRTPKAHLIVKKKQPRRIVLEETNEGNQTGRGKLMDQILCCHDDILIRLSEPKKYWREVKESDSSLTNEEPKLSLTVDECREIFHCKTANTMNKIREFLKDK